MEKKTIFDMDSYTTESFGISSLVIKDISELNFFISNLASLPTYVWRGQKNTDWKLQPSLSRIIDTDQPLDTLKDIFKDHLKTFQYASRGRRGANPQKLEENEWWALAQHHGLATPLLDWSNSPYVASFFAFNDPYIDSEKKEFRVLYGLSMSALKFATTDAKLNGDRDTIEFFKPLTDDNARLVSQNGLFTIGPVSKDIESWISENAYYLPRYKSDKGEGGYVTLFKVMISESLREDLLRLLNRMNINHLTLFPDLEGASLYANMCLKIPNYN